MVNIFTIQSDLPNARPNPTRPDLTHGLIQPMSISDVGLEVVKSQVQLLDRTRLPGGDLGQIVK